MKKSEIATIVLIVAICAGVAYGVIQATPIGKSVSQNVNVKTIDQISPNVQSPDTRIFNKNAINPSVKITINQSNAQ